MLTAAFATQPHGGETPEEVVRHDQRLGELLPVVFGAKGPIGVVDGSGELVGILDRRMVIHVLAGREEPSVPEELPGVSVSHADRDDASSPATRFGICPVGAAAPRRRPALHRRRRRRGLPLGFPANWFLGVPRWFDSLSNWVTNNDSTNFFLHHIVTGFGNLLNSATNDVVNLLHWMTWVGVLGVATVVRLDRRHVAHRALLRARRLLVRRPADPERRPERDLADVAERDDDARADDRRDHPLDDRRHPARHRLGDLAEGEQALRPVLDLMQILPAFAYLVPIVVLFSIGNPAGIIATFIYAVPPLVRFTELGIRSVKKDVIEAAESFGSTRGQILRNVQLPLAAQAIMLGLNQVIMMALSIVVIASLIGAGGLGDPVLNALQTQQIGEGAVAGLLIVLDGDVARPQLGGVRAARHTGPHGVAAQPDAAAARRPLGRRPRRDKNK